MFPTIIWFTYQMEQSVSALKITQGINVAVTSEKKTIVTLDLQLYSKCMQMCQNDEIKNIFIFRLGKLHVVFAYLKVLGKYVLGSGIEEILIHAGVYCSTTLSQILQGKHMKIVKEVHMVIYLSLYKIYLQNFFELHPEMKVRIIEKTQMLFTKTNLTEALWSKVLADLRNEGLSDMVFNFDNTLKETSLFLQNYMLMY